MIKKTLGRTKLEVTQLGFGAMELARDYTTEKMAESTLNTVLDMGINFIDTAACYGSSEERIGKFIGKRRDEFYLATKCGCNPKHLGGDGVKSWTKANIMKHFEGSLKRLQTDRVDVLQLHNPRDADLDEAIEALKEIQNKGQTRFIGISSTWQFIEMRLQMDVFDTFQIPYSCLSLGHGGSITKVGEAGCGVVVRGGIAQGGPDANEHKKARPPIQRSIDRWDESGCKDLLEEGMTETEMILRFTLSHPHCHTVICGTKNPEHVKANAVAAAKGPLSEDLCNEITRRIKETDERLAAAAAV